MAQSDLESSDEQPKGSPSEGEQDNGSSPEGTGEQQEQRKSSAVGVPRPMNWNQAQLPTIRTSLGAKRGQGLDFLYRNLKKPPSADKKVESSLERQSESNGSEIIAPDRDSLSSIRSPAEKAYDENKDDSVFKADDQGEREREDGGGNAENDNQSEKSSSAIETHKLTLGRSEEVGSAVPCASGRESKQAGIKNTNYESSTEEDTSDYEDDKGVVLNIISNDNSDLESGEIEDGGVKDDASMDISDEEDGEIGEEEEDSSEEDRKSISNGYESSEEGEVTDDSNLNSEDEDEDDYDSETDESSDRDDMVHYADSSATGKHVSSDHGLSKKRRKLSAAEKAAWAKYSDEEKMKDGRMRPNPVVIGHLGRADLKYHLQTHFFLQNPSEVSPLELVFCQLCLQRGHLVDYPCPQLTCDTCGVFSQHVTRDCPINRVCMKCRQQGHDAWDCTISRQVTPDEIPCWLCTRLGHWEQNCETLWCTPPYNFESDVNLDIVKNYGCYSCGAKGHLGNDCPRREPGKPMGTSLWSAKAWSLPHPTSGRCPPIGSKDDNDGIIYPGPSGLVMASQRWHKKTMYIWEEDSRHKSSAYYYPRKENHDGVSDDTDNELEKVGKRKNLGALPTRGNAAPKTASKIKITTPGSVPGNKNETAGGRGGNQSTAGRGGGTKPRGRPEISGASNKRKKRARPDSPPRPRGNTGTQSSRGGPGGSYKPGGASGRSQRLGDGGGRGGRGGGRGGRNSRGGGGSKEARGGGQRHVPMPSSAANAWRRFRS